MTSQEFDTSWIKPGAPVVIYHKNRRLSEAAPHRTTIKRVASDSFTVERKDILFNIESLESPRSGSFYGWIYGVTPAGSELAYDLLASG